MNANAIGGKKTKMKTVALIANDIRGYPADKGVKTFEVCLDHEPTTDEIYALQGEAGQWQNLKVIKLRPASTKSEKMFDGKFWTLSFAVHEDDWLFWCGFCAGKKWGITNSGRGDAKKKRLFEIGQWSVQI
jgi:hypothetical protein